MSTLQVSTLNVNNVLNVANIVLVGNVSINSTALSTNNQNTSSLTINTSTISVNAIFTINSSAVDVNTSSQLSVSGNTTAISALHSDVGTNLQIFTTNGTYTQPPNAELIILYMWGAGGGGAAATNSSSTTKGTGGGGGGFGSWIFPANLVPNTFTVTVGGGGRGNNTVNSIGWAQAQTGGNSSVLILKQSMGNNYIALAVRGGSGANSRSTSNRGITGGYITTYFGYVGVATYMPVFGPESTVSYRIGGGGFGANPLTNTQDYLDSVYGGGGGSANSLSTNSGISIIAGNGASYSVAAGYPGGGGSGSGNNMNGNNGLVMIYTIRKVS